MQAKTRFELQWDKLAAAVVYLAKHSRMPPRFGETKLVTLLYYADSASYVRTLRPITGATYVRGTRAAFPASWSELVAGLEREGAIKVAASERKIKRTHYVVKSIAATPKAKADALSEPEQALIDEQLKRFAKCDANKMLRYLNKEIAWRTTIPGDAIPYELSGIRYPDPPDEETLARGRRIAERIRKEGRQLSRVLVAKDEAV